MFVQYSGAEKPPRVEDWNANMSELSSMLREWESLLRVKPLDAKSRARCRELKYKIPSFVPPGLYAFDGANGSTGHVIGLATHAFTNAWLVLKLVNRVLMLEPLEEFMRPANFIEGGHFKEGKHHYEVRNWLKLMQSPIHSVNGWPETQAYVWCDPQSEIDYGHLCSVTEPHGRVEATLYAVLSGPAQGRLVVHPDQQFGHGFKESMEPSHQYRTHCALVDILAKLKS